MNILICNSYKIYETQGGTERISSRLARSFTALGHHCFLAYKEDKHLESPENCFVEEIDASQDSIECFILRNHIDVILIQKMTRDVKLLYNIKKKYNLSFKIISALHFEPAFEEYNLSFGSFYSGLFHYSNPKDFLKDLTRALFYPFYKLMYPLRNQELYRTVYSYSDKVVLLSQSFIQQYKKYAKLSLLDKFVVIPNALSFNEYLDEKEISRKKNQVLLVSRLVENPKRISWAIKIWAEIEKKMPDWSFKIVGDGQDRLKYEKLVEKLHLHNVEFCGRKNPKSYYKESKVFVMTSANEGWGLTLTEAQQFGCVPIAFNSYSSLKDIIVDGENGFIVCEGDINGFVNKLLLLMTDSSFFSTMSCISIKSSKRFGLDKILKLWEKLFKE